MAQLASYSVDYKPSHESEGDISGEIHEATLDIRAMMQTGYVEMGKGWHML